MCQMIKPARWFIAYFDRHTGLTVEHFNNQLTYGRKIKEIERLHQRGQVDEYTHGEIELS